MKYYEIIALPKVCVLPESAQKFGDLLALNEEPAEDNGVALVMYLFPHQDKIYKIKCQPDPNLDTISKIINVVLRDALSSDTNITIRDHSTENDATERIIKDDPDFIRVLNIVAGQLAVKDIRISKNDPNTIAFVMVSGEVWTAARDQINWEENAKELNNMTDATNQIKSIIKLVNVASDEDLNANLDQINKFIDDFHTGHNMHPKYDYIAEIPLRQQLTIKLIDLMTVVYQMIASTIDVSAMRMIRQLMAPPPEAMLQPADAQTETPAEVVDVLEEETTETPTEFGEALANALED